MSLNTKDLTVLNAHTKYKGNTKTAHLFYKQMLATLSKSNQKISRFIHSGVITDFSGSYEHRRNLLYALAGRNLVSARDYYTRVQLRSALLRSLRSLIWAAGVFARRSPRNSYPYGDHRNS